MLTTGLRINSGSKKKITKRINPMWTKTEADGNQKAAIVLQGGNMVDGELVRFRMYSEGRANRSKTHEIQEGKERGQGLHPTWAAGKMTPCYQLK